MTAPGRHGAAAAKPDGTVIVMDENVAGTLRAPGDPVQRFFGAASHRLVP